MTDFYGSKTIYESKLYQFGLHHFLLKDMCNNRTRLQIGGQEELVKDKPVGDVTPDLKISFEFWEPINHKEGSLTRFIAKDDKKTSNFLDIDAFFEQIMYKGEHRSIDWNNAQEVVNKFFTCFGVLAVDLARRISGERQINGRAKENAAVDFVTAALCVAFQNPAAIWLELSLPRPIKGGGEEDAYCYIKGVRPRQSH